MMRSLLHMAVPARMTRSVFSSSVTAGTARSVTPIPALSITRFLLTPLLSICPPGAFLKSTLMMRPRLHLAVLTRVFPFARRTPLVFAVLLFRLVVGARYPDQRARYQQRENILHHRNLQLNCSVRLGIRIHDPIVSYEPNLKPR